MTYTSPRVRSYFLYTACMNAFFWLPVFFLFFSSHLSFADVLILESIYYFSVVLFEVPSGYASDRLGRKPTLVAAQMLLLAAYGTFVFGDSFLTLAIAQALLGMGFAFNSGTDTAYLYETLADDNHESLYPEYEGKAASIGAFTTGAAVIVGGLTAYAFGLVAPYVLSCFASATGLACALSFRGHRRSASPQPETAFLSQIGRSLALLRTPQIAWVFGFVVLMTVLNHIPYILQQPYLAALDPEQAPLWSGLLTALAAFLGGIAIRYSIVVAKNRGFVFVALSALVIQLLLIAIFLAPEHVAIAILLALRGVPSAVTAPQANAVVTPLLPESQRATFLSLQSLTGRLAFGGFLALLGLVTRESAVGITPVALVGLTTAVIGLIALLTFRHWATSRQERP